MKQIKKLVLFLSLILSVSFAASNVYVETQAQTIRLNKTAVTLYVGGTRQLKVTGTTKKVTWSSGNKNVATVTSKGKVTAKKVGKATIYAKVKGKKLSCKVTVKKKSTTYVWIPKTGKKYHKYKTCSNMKDPSKVTLSKAKSMGYTACKKCY